MVCPACGTPNPPNREFCATCRTRLEATRTTPAEIREGRLRVRRLPTPASVPKSTNLSVASLVLGLVSLAPVTFITGIPAVICGAVALKQRRPGRRMAIAGIATGAFGTLVLTFAMLLPLMARQRELTRVAAVRRNMRAYQSALEDYAVGHAGRYPYAGVSWEPEDDDGMVLHFKSGNQLPTGVPTNPYTGERYSDAELLYLRSGNQFPTGIPVNPYTGERYRNGKDFFYRSDYLAGTGLNAVIDRRDAKCPFAGLAAPGGVPGTIVILGWAPLEDLDSPTEYAVVGYGGNTSEPLAARRGRIFFVMHN